MGRFCIGILIVIAALSVSSGCSRAEFTPAPNIPAQYYNCLEVTPGNLIYAYYSHYSDTFGARALYDNQVFIIKNIELTRQRLSRVADGYMWIEDVKCLLLDGASVSKYRPGDRVDVIGINLGITTNLEVPVGLVFKDCVVIPAGSLALPPEGNEAPLAAPY